MWNMKDIYPSHSGDAVQRKGMRLSIIEGISAIIVFNLLGGAYLTGYLLYLGANAATIGLITAIPFLTQIFQIYGAFLIQKYNHDRRVWIAWLAGIHRMLWALTGAVPFLFPESLWIPVFFLLFTISWGAIQIAVVFWGSLMGDMVPPEVRGRFFGFRNALLAGIGSVILMAGGWILDIYPGGFGFAILFTISFLAAGWNFIVFLKHPNMPFEPSSVSGRWNMFIKPFRDRAFYRTIWFISLWSFFQGLAIPLFGFVMLDILSVSYKTVAIVTTVQTIATTVSFFVWGILNDRFKSSHLLLWALPIYALSALLWGTMAFLPMMVVLLLAHVFLGVSMAGYNMLLFNFLIGDTPADDRPMYIASFSAVTGIFAFLGPVTGGIIFQSIKGWPMWIQSYGLFSIVGMILFGLSVFVAPRIFLIRPSSVTAGN